MKKAKEIVILIITVAMLLLMTSCTGWYATTSSYDPYRYGCTDYRYPYYNQYDIWLNSIYTPYNYNRYGYYPYNNYTVYYNTKVTKLTPKKEIKYTPSQDTGRTNSRVDKPKTYPTRRSNTVQQSPNRGAVTPPTRTRIVTPTRTKTRYISPTRTRTTVKSQPRQKAIPIKRKNKN